MQITQDADKENFLRPYFSCGWCGFFKWADLEFTNGNYHYHPNDEQYLLLSKKVIEMMGELISFYPKKPKSDNTMQGIDDYMTMIDKSSQNNTNFKINNNEYSVVPLTFPPSNNKSPNKKD